MNEIVVLLVLLIIAVFVVPIITLVKLSSIGSRIANIEHQLERMNAINSKEKIAEEKVTEEKVAEEKAAVVPESPVYEAPEPVVEEEVYASLFATKEVLIEEPTPEKPEPVRLNTLNTKARNGLHFVRFENLLSKIGIITLVLGIAFFVKYAIDKDWINEVGRVAIGVLTGGAMIGIAHKLRKNYNLFAALLVGGGISALYIAITLAFREYHLLSQPLSFGILVAITLFSVILSLVYDRKELALFSLLGGYASPLMISTGEGNYIVLFSFILILNTGMLIISMRKKWNMIGIVSFVCTFLFYWVWLFASFKNQYTGAVTFVVLFFVQFYLLALFDHLLSGRKISPFQVAMILANNLSVFAALIMIFDETQWKVRGIITISVALVNAVVMIILFRNIRVDKRLIFLIIAIVLSFVSLAVPMQLNGHVITMFWAAEIVILLWMWWKTGIKIFYAGFILISILTLVSYLMDVWYIYTSPTDNLPVIFNRIFITGLVVISAFTASRMMFARMENSAQAVAGQSILHRYFTLTVIAVSFLAPFMEIGYQFGYGELHIRPFTLMTLAVYTTIYAAVLAVVYRKELPKATWRPAAFGAFVVAYLLIALPIIVDLREIVFNTGLHKTLFLLHYVSLPALAVIFYLIITSMRQLSKKIYVFSGWALVVSAVVVLSVELDCTVAQFFATPATYNDLLYDVHTIGYPILWGVLAMALMIWGLKAREVLLRQISLVFFSFIILKFYVSDIWLMSQTGRIISFVVLGVILLLVSFLMQKIKDLIKDDDKNSPNEN